MVNHNGVLVSVSDSKIGPGNRAFKYGDGVFDTLKYEDGVLQFFEDHYFRLMSSMRMLRMKIPMDFTLDYYESQIRKTLEANNLTESGRVRANVYRADGGFYTPETNQINFLIEAQPLKRHKVDEVEIELFKDFPITSGLLSTIKTNNRLVNVLGSIYAKENGFQNCVLINEKKEVVETLNSNIFLVKGTVVITPSLESGCINGIIRKKLIEVLKKAEDFSIQESHISPFDLLKVDEVFLTNSINEIQSVHRYRKKKFVTERTAQIVEIFKRVDKK